MRKRQTKLPEDLTELLAPIPPALKAKDLHQIREAVDLPPEEFQKAMVPALQRAVVKGLANVPEPTTWKELTAANKLLREASGIDAKEKGAAFVGLVGFARPAGKRSLGVVDVETVDEYAGAFD